MIDLNFIIPYTNSLYSTHPDLCPRYDEFRDMFSEGQLKSKEWITEELAKIDPDFLYKSVAIAGSWFGTLGMMLKYKFPTILVTMIDIDPRCEAFINNMVYDDGAMRAVTKDMYTYRYIEDIIINTSCEHIPDIEKWISLLPKGRLVVLQSNNYTEEEDHINCITSKEELIEQSGLTNIIFAGELEFSMYTRYMIIGRT